MNSLEHFHPLGHIRLGGFQTKLGADSLGESALFKHNGSFVEDGDCAVFDDAVRLDVAEHGDFLDNGVFERLVAAKNDDTGVDSHALQLFYGVLSGFCLVFVGAAEVGDESYVDEE